MAKTGNPGADGTARGVPEHVRDANGPGIARPTVGRNRTVRTCSSCRFWSQMVAQSIGCGPIEALCL
jgi:hypothetical protein